MLGIDEPALLDALTHGSADSRALGNIARAGSAAAFIDAVGDFIGKDVAVVRETVAELGGDLGALTTWSTPGCGNETRFGECLILFCENAITVRVTSQQPSVTIPAIQHSLEEYSMTKAKLVFDPFSQDFFNNPYEIYRRMRDEAPVYYNDERTSTR